jgi:sugar phosphate isomerase/epimerase
MFSLSTRWNAARHTTGEAMIDEIVALGFQSVELGFDLRLPLVEGVRRRIQENVVKVQSVHNFCPLPVGAQVPHPELFLLASCDEENRKSAVRHTETSIGFAREIGASVVVAHAGYVDMGMWVRTRTATLVSMLEKDTDAGPEYERCKMRLLEGREKHVERHLEALYRSLDELVPNLKSSGVRLGLELLPTWEAIPTEMEMQAILKRYPGGEIVYWHDFGHGRIRENLGLSAHGHWFQKLGPSMVGMHVHDVFPPANDHLMPPQGRMNFGVFRNWIRPDQIMVLEPAPGTPAAEVLEGARIISAEWFGSGVG